MKTTLLTLLGCLLTLPALAAEKGSARLIVEPATGKVLVSEGPVKTRHSPCSTFKIPLAVMGFDAEILTSPTEPVWEYNPEKHEAHRPEEKQATNPLDWEKNSVVWFSQELATRLGAETFRDYIREFRYGNEDISGDHGKNNGLTHSWLSSSLQISPEEQIAFLERFFRSELGVTEAAYRHTQAILPKFDAGDGWTVHGKTGSDGKNLGWFVGWAEKGDRRLLFVELLNEELPPNVYGGPKARDRFLKALPDAAK